MARKLPTIDRLDELLYLDDEGILRWREARGRCRAGSPAMTYEVVNAQGLRYANGRLDRRNLQRARVVFALVHGRWPVGEVRHVDGDTLNDHPSNLVDPGTDPRGRGRIGASSRYYGVNWDGHGWRARRRVEGKRSRSYLGTFATQEEAGRAYDAAERDGVFADYGRVRNFPEAAA